MVGWEVRTDLESQLQFVLGKFVDEGVDTERGLVVAIYSVVHHEELTVRRVDRQCLH